jgi:hypothetical protein
VTVPELLRGSLQRATDWHGVVTVPTPKPRRVPVKFLTVAEGGAVKRALVILVSATVWGLSLASVASARAPLPTPGTAGQDAALVKAATSIKDLPSNLIPALSAAPTDDADSYYPSSDIGGKGCGGVTCVYGDLSSSTTVVLWGDSHAQMWLPALAPDATQLKVKLVLIWHSGCSVEDFAMANATCDTYRTQDIALIKTLKPAMVILSQKVTQITGPNGKVYTNVQWTSDLEVTIRALQSSTTTVVVAGDTNQFDSAVPSCLSIHPTNVQRCTIFNPNPKFTQHFKAEATAATATHADYVNPTPWMCTTKCSAVVGTMVVASDTGHLTATFAEYLSGLWLTDLDRKSVV